VYNFHFFLCSTYIWPGGVTVRALDLRWCPAAGKVTVGHASHTDSRPEEGDAHPAYTRNGASQARRQEMKWGGCFVKKWTFPHKMKRNWIKLCFVIYDSNQLFTINDLHSWNAMSLFSHNKCGKIAITHWELDLFFILHFTYLGWGCVRTQHTPLPTGL